jgi:hypothetical protein
MDRFRGWFRDLVEDIRVNGDLRESSRRAADAQTFERVVRALERLRERGQTTWISIAETGRPRVYVGEHCPGDDWALLTVPPLDLHEAGECHHSGSAICVTSPFEPAQSGFAK